MRNTSTSSSALPVWPRKDCTLRAHPNGQWYKQHNGRRYYFGVHADVDAAWADYKARWPFISSGLPDPADQKTPSAELTMDQIAQEYLGHLDQKRLTHEIGMSYFENVRSDVRVILEHQDASGGTFRHRRATSITPAEWHGLRMYLEAHYGADGVSHKVGTLRSMSGWAADAHKIDFDFANRMPPVTKSERRDARRQAEKKRGTKLLPKEQLQMILDECTMPIDAMFLLSLNCGFTAADCSAIRVGDVDLQKGTFHFDRVKTGVERFGYLWPVTVQAIQQAILHRPKVSVSLMAKARAEWEAQKPEGREAIRRWSLKEPAWDQLIFLTRFGQPWVRHQYSSKERDDGTRAPVHMDHVGLLFRRVLARLDEAHPKGVGGLPFKRCGISFGAGRHTYFTAAKRIDKDAARYVMGHSDDTMGEWYDHLDEGKKQQLFDLCNALGKTLLGETQTYRGSEPIRRLRLAGVEEGMAEAG